MDKINVQKQYSLWQKNATADMDLVAELKSIDGNESEIYDRFYRELEFGTGGLRGIIGVGTNRMNYYTVRKATQGIANNIIKSGLSKSVVIGYDSRINSGYFAKTAAEVFAGNGVKVYIFPTLIPTPVVSFTVRELGAAAGINITASHNPARYNGYKVYSADGCQITDNMSSKILFDINNVNIFDGVKFTAFDTALDKYEIAYVSDEIIERYYLAVREQSILKDICRAQDLKVVYTPFNGAGNIPVRRVLSDIGIEDITIVPEQELPDGDFPTCPYPNPEIMEASKLGLELCDKVKPDLFLAIDPDCDRVGIAAPNNDGEYILLSGNETGVLLLEYIIRQRIAAGTLPKNPVVISTIVTTPLAKKICDKYGVKFIETLTGFKYIGEQIGILENNGKHDSFIFGLEESCGYLVGTYARDKDAVVASMLICEMTAFYRSKGISLHEALIDLYEEYGYYYNALESFSFGGESGIQHMQGIMSDLRNNPPEEINSRKVTLIEDYLIKKNTPSYLPRSDVIALTLDDETKIIVRPSGTEAKLKIYHSTIAKTMPEAQQLQQDYAVSIGDLCRLKK